MSTENEKVTEKFTLALLVLRVLSLVEKLLPAFLVAWNNELRNKNKALEMKLKNEQLKDSLEVPQHEPAQLVIDRFLDRNAGHGPDPKPK